MDVTRSAWQHFDRSDWVSARDGFAAVLGQRPDDPGALDGFGQSLWWLGERNGDRRAA